MEVSKWQCVEQLCQVLHSVAEKVRCSSLQAPTSAEVGAVKWIVPVTEVLNLYEEELLAISTLLDGQGKCYMWEIPFCLWFIYMREMLNWLDSDSVQYLHPTELTKSSKVAREYLIQ